MQTSAPTLEEPDLFGAAPAPQPSTGLRFVLEGTLAADGVVRMRMHDHGDGVPVLCLDLHDVGPALNSVHVELPFPAGQHGRVQADIAALKCRRGTRLSVTHPVTGMQLVLPHAMSITYPE